MRDNRLYQLKLDVHGHCLQNILSREQQLLEQIKGLEIALRSETKSSAGDKHETTRAMVQLEREKIGSQLRHVEHMKTILKRAAPSKIHTQIGLGSLVITEHNLFYLAISASIYEHNDHQVFCVSLSSPVGKLLVGKTAGDFLMFNNINTPITKVV